MGGSLSVDQRMTLVDPIAERQLLGAAGEFLEPLIALSGERPTDFDTIERWASDRDTAEARQITAMLQDQRDSEAAFRAGPAYAEYLRIKAERNEEPDANLLGGRIGPMVPILLSEAADLRPLRAELSVESFGPSPNFPRQEPGDTSYVPPPPVPDAIRNGEPGVALPPVRVDASALLDSRFNGAVALPWPGSTVDAPTTPSLYPYSLDLSSSASVHDAAPTDIVVTADGRHQVRLDGIGFGRLVADETSSFGFSSTPDTTVRQGATDSEALFGAVRKLGRGNTGQGEYAGAISVGGFGVADEEAITELAAGTPLGAYEPNQATLLADGDGQTAAPGTMVGGFGTLGLAGNRTGAIADIRSAAFAWENKVDAVRVRVAGVDSYDAAGITAVVRTARDIERLGYRAVIVAGSQSEAVSVSVGNFAFGTMDAAEPQQVGELGVIEQRWSVLGPAAGAGLSLSAGTQLLLGTAIAAVLGAFAVSELTGVAARRREAEVLRSLGWRRGRIVRWFAADYAMALPLLALAGLAAVLLAAEQALSAAVIAVALLVVATVVISSLSRSTRAPITRTASEAELLTVLEFEYRPEARVLGEDPSAGPLDQPVAPARPSKPLRMPRSAVLWGVQRAWRTPAESLPRACAVLAVMAPLAALSAAAAEPGGGGLAQLMLAACGVGAGLVLLASVRRGSPVAAPASETVLLASGWPSRDVRLAGMAATLAGPLAAVFLGSYALWFVLSSVGVDGVNTAVSAALVAGLGATALFLLPRRPSASRAPSPQPIPARKAALSRGIAS
ncbi:hypothetical protein AWU67_03330 [Microterricola viridarii]|uniref:FtsX-like permease family protein n=1 Tax=Microterricola viridarii TaxID=412690 RepID=A0A109QWH9_9MICO|nr:hypothetical protein AWU67_03330 [Microterricola viridarii]